LEALFYFGKKSRLGVTNGQKFNFERTEMDQVCTMIVYEKIFRQPQVANSLIGMSLVEFEELYATFETIYIAREMSLEHTRRHKGKRQRAVGAGRKHKYSLCNRLLMTLFWLRAYTTYEVLGFLYGLDKTTVADNLNDMLEVLANITTYHIELPAAEVPKLHSVQEVMNSFPELRLMMDT
jgi:hypothetical protein